MSKTFFKLIIIVTLAFSTSGCAVIGTALAAGASYGIYQAISR